MLRCHLPSESAAPSKLSAASGGTQLSIRSGFNSAFLFGVPNSFLNFQTLLIRGLGFVSHGHSCDCITVPGWRDRCHYQVTGRVQEEDTQPKHTESISAPKKCKFKESPLSILPGKDSFLENKYQGVPHRHADFEQGLERNTYFGEKNTVACQTLGAYELIFLRSIWPFIFNTVVSTAGKPECFKIT